MVRTIQPPLHVSALCAQCHSSTNPGHVLASHPFGQAFAKVLVSFCLSRANYQEKMSTATFEKPCPARTPALTFLQRQQILGGECMKGT